MIQDIATVFWRDWIVLRHRLLKFILSRMVAPVLYMVAFGWGLARSVNTGGGSYLDFIVPGILALNSMNIAFNSLTPLCTEREAVTAGAKIFSNIKQMPYANRL